MLRAVSAGTTAAGSTGQGRRAAGAFRAASFAQDAPPPDAGGGVMARLFTTSVTCGPEYFVGQPRGGVTVVIEGGVTNDAEVKASNRRATICHGDPDVKAALVGRAVLHQEADRLRQGFGFMRPVRTKEWPDDAGDPGEIKGCAIGCLVTPVGLVRVAEQQQQEFVALGSKRMVTKNMRYSRDRVAKDLRRDFGLPRYLTYLVEDLFEDVSPGKAQEWPREFAESLVPGSRISDRDVVLFCASFEGVDLHETVTNGKKNFTVFRHGVEDDEFADHLAEWLAAQPQEIVRKAKRVPKVTTPEFDPWDELPMDEPVVATVS